MMQTICVQSFSQWRKEARELLATGVPPHAVQWSEALQSDDLFGAVEQPRQAYGAADVSTTAPANPRETARIPREMLRMLETAACFRAPDRYAFLYKIVWRWQLGQKDVLSPADEDGARLNVMIKTIRR